MPTVLPFLVLLQYKEIIECVKENVLQKQSHFLIVQSGFWLATHRNNSTDWSLLPFISGGKRNRKLGSGHTFPRGYRLCHNTCKQHSDGRKSFVDACPASFHGQATSWWRRQRLGVVVVSWGGSWWWSAVSFLQLVSSTHFLFCFAHLKKKKNGKHSDGVQQGELKENAKEEEKSAD